MNKFQRVLDMGKQRQLAEAVPFAALTTMDRDAWAEAYAELMHTQLRSMWGFPDRPDMTMLERFRAEYQGKRYSFGYPACPKLEDQEKLFAVLRPEDIGVQLTDGFMMEPEASVSAIVLHHPSASYFSVA